MTLKIVNVVSIEKRVFLLNEASYSKMNSIFRTYVIFWFRPMILKIVKLVGTVKRVFLLNEAS
jgi:uncharacterized membrane protein